MLALLLHLYFLFVRITSKVKVHYSLDSNSSSPDILSSLQLYEENQVAIYTFWNERILYFLHYFNKRSITSCVFPLKKSDFISRFARFCSRKTVIGTLEGGGRHSILVLLDVLKKGDPVALSADGTMGVAKECKSASFLLAQDANCPIIPMSWQASREFKIKIQGYDYFLPSPFSCIDVKIGTLIKVNKHHKFQELQDVKETLKKFLEKT